MASDHPPLQADVNPAWRIGIVASMWHKDVVDSLVDAAVHTLTGAGIPSGNITRHDAAGSSKSMH
jgi:6,7-dimethyl-8-ribityllumazine synthase